MAVANFQELKEHIGHKVECVGYGKDEIVNAVIECEDCSEILMDFDKDEE